MRIAIYDPYLDTLGGGERYLLTLASGLSQMHSVTIFWSDTTIAKRIRNRLGISINNVSIVDHTRFFSNAVERIRFTRQYDRLVFVSDGSLPIFGASKTIFHVQVPFPYMPGSWWKRYVYSSVICNSQFTKDNMDKNLGTNAKIIYPPVNTNWSSHSIKENIILSVGRFSAHYQAKKQEILIKTFIEGHKQDKFKGWKLVLVGGLLDSDEQYFTQLQNEAKGYPIIFYKNLHYSELKKLYCKAKIYWHAAGMGTDNPMEKEHFGIAPVEAMSAECVPIVFNGGGLCEIIKEGYNGYLFSSERELLTKTLLLIHRNFISTSALKISANKYSDKKFMYQWNIAIR